VLLGRLDERSAPSSSTPLGASSGPELTPSHTPAEARGQIRQVPVPFGMSTAPTNACADGRSCLLRHRCPGCTYFRTHPSHQTELRCYPAQLLTDRERLTTAINANLSALVDWKQSCAAGV
jgi:hypothetical protein